MDTMFAPLFFLENVFCGKKRYKFGEIALKLCDIQGILFELSANQKYDSIKSFVCL